jgi:CO/xanthine dehydrogenase FAD-binding subunit
MTVRVETYQTLAEAQRAVGADAVFMAGGTIVMRDVNAGAAPARIVRTTDRQLTETRPAGDAVTIGAGVRMVDVLRSGDLAFLHTVARAIGGPQVRSMATVGGNLFAAHPYGDFAAALLALGAKVVMAGQTGIRPIEDALRDRARPGLVAAIQVPRPRDVRTFAFAKVARVKPKGVSILSIAVNLPREGGRIRGARVAYGAMGPAPLRASAVERVLEGQALDAATIGRAAAVAAEGLDPPTDSLASAWYRREVAGVHLRRILESMERA